MVVSPICQNRAEPFGAHRAGVRACSGQVMGHLASCLGTLASGKSRRSCTALGPGRPLRDRFPCGGSFDCAPGSESTAGRFCGGASLRMTRLS